MSRPPSRLSRWKRPNHTVVISTAHASGRPFVRRLRRMIPRNSVSSVKPTSTPAATTASSRSEAVLQSTTANWAAMASVQRDRHPQDRRHPQPFRILEHEVPSQLDPFRTYAVYEETD